MRDPHDKKAFAVAMQALCAVRRVEPTKPLLHGYWMVLQPFDLDAVVSAIAAEMAADEDFMPSPGKLRKALRPKPRPWVDPYKGLKATTMKTWDGIPPMRDEWLALPAMQEPKEGES